MNIKNVCTVLFIHIQFEQTLIWRRLQFCIFHFNVHVLYYALHCNRNLIKTPTLISMKNIIWSYRIEANLCRILLKSRRIIISALLYNYFDVYRGLKEAGFNPDTIRLFGNQVFTHKRFATETAKAYFCHVICCQVN